MTNEPENSLAPALPRGSVAEPIGQQLAATFEGETDGDDVAMLRKMLIRSYACAIGKGDAAEARRSAALIAQLLPVGSAGAASEAEEALQRVREHLSFLGDERDSACELARLAACRILQLEVELDN